METITEQKEMKKSTGILIAMILASLGLSGQSLTQDQFDNAYVCELWEDTENTYFFKGGLSGTEFRGYPNELNRKGYKDCKLGDERLEWIKLSKYAESNGIDPMNLLMQQKDIIINPSESEISDTPYIRFGKTKAISYDCDNSNCYEVN